MRRPARLDFRSILQANLEGREFLVICSSELNLIQLWSQYPMKKQIGFDESMAANLQIVKTIKRA
jgi:hypothetical protein